MCVSEGKGDLQKFSKFENWAEESKKYKGKWVMAKEKRGFRGSRIKKIFYIQSKNNSQFSFVFLNLYVSFSYTSRI